MLRCVLTAHKLLTLLVWALICNALPGSVAMAADVPLAALKAPQAFAMIRHALAPGFSDPADFVIGDCSSQRNLNATGRAQAQAIGAAIRAQGISFDRVLTSQWCRCRETAALLAVGPVEELPALNSFFEEPVHAKPQTAALSAFMQALPAGEKVLLVTHYVNISAYLGLAVSSGEMVIATRKSSGDPVVLKRFLMPP